MLRGPAWRLTVADTGPGIPPEHVPRLTERFYRVDTGRSRTQGGTGLGLAIVKHIVNRHRGRLRIESVEGQGTEVTVILPGRLTLRPDCHRTDCHKTVTLSSQKANADCLVLLRADLKTGFA